MTPEEVLQEVQFLDKYSRLSPTGERETWQQSVDRTVSFLRELSDNRLSEKEYDFIRRMILEKKAMPSMRLLAMAGEAARRTNVSLFNCSYMPIDDPIAFKEAVLILMSGTGLGYSVERKYTDRLPGIAHQTGATDSYSVPDTTEGWAEAVYRGVMAWLRGRDVTFDLSQIRPEGTPLKVKGGIASGPQHLERALERIKAIVLSRQGQHLQPLDVHDMMCHIADAVVSGGVRRCLPKGSRIHTRRGAIPIEEVVIGDEVMTERGYKNVTGWSNEGKKEIVELVTQSGTIFRCTPDHRIAILADVYGGYTFKEAQDITPEDRVLFVRHTIDGNHQTLFPLPNKREADHSGSSIRQPELDEETAWFLGKFFADGYVQTTPHNERGKGGNTTVSVACHEDETNQIERILSWFYSHGLHVGITSGENGERCTKLRTNNRQIARWLANYKQAGNTLVIPEEIWRATPETRRSFLAGVTDGDGAVNNRPLVLCSTVYETFARDLAKLYTTLGIITEVRLNRPAIGVWQPLWHLVVKEKESRDRAVNIINEFGCKTAVTKKKQQGYTVPGTMVKSDLKYMDYGRMWDGSGDMNAHTLGQITGQDWFVPVIVNEVRYAGTANVYDIEVKDGEVFVAEGYLVHNSAMIALFDATDNEMLACKSGDHINGNTQRWNANNSMVISGYKPLTFWQKYLADMHDSQRGEPGIFSRYALENTLPERRDKSNVNNMGCNPCGEVNLKSQQFCNLSSAVCRVNDTAETLSEKVIAATIIGTIQSTATNYPELRPQWAENCNEERLLGVDLMGVMDCPAIRDAVLLQELRQLAVRVNREYAEKLGINPSVAITCSKPSGNSSVLLDASPGIHARWSPYYIRRVTLVDKNPIRKALAKAGVPMERKKGTDNQWVVSFPVKSPDGAICTGDLSALDQLENWKLFKLNWTEHNPSCTITYQPHELEAMGQWLFDNQAIIGGLSFLPRFDAQYEQMPYEAITAEQYDVLLAEFPFDVDLSHIRGVVNVAATPACDGDICELPTN